MLSVIIIAKNEAANIGRCLQSVHHFADEIIVLDSGSNDATMAIARQYTDKVFATDWQGYGIQKQRALALATGDWVLNLDADESVDLKLKSAIEQAIRSDEADAFRIPIRQNFYGKPLRYSSSPSRHIRLFKREGARYSEDIVHEKVVLPDNWRVKQIKQAICHYSYQDLSHALYKVNRYSSYSAKIRIKNKKAPSFIKVLAASGWMFFRSYVLQRGFLDGKEGLVFAFLNAEGAFYRGMKQLYPDSNLHEIPDI